MQIFDLEEEDKLLHDLPLKRVTALNWSPDSKTLVVATEEGIVCFFNTVTGKRIRELKEKVSSLAWSPDGKWLAVGNKLYSSATWKPVRTLEADGSLLSWSPDSKYVASGFNICEAATGKVAAPLENRFPTIGYPVSWSPDSSSVASLYYFVISIHDARTGKLRARVLPLGSGDSIIINPEGHYRATPRAESEFVYVVLTDKGEQVTLTPAEFKKRYGWTNRPDRVQLMDRAPLRSK